MGERVGRKLGHRAACFLNHIVGCRCAGGHSVAGYIGNIEEFLCHGLLGALEFFGNCALLFFEHCYAFFGFCGVILTAFLHGFADRGCHFVEFGGGSIVFELKTAAEVVEGKHTGDRFLALEAFDRQTGYDALGVGFNLLYSKHFTMMILSG